MGAFDFQKIQKNKRERRQQQLGTLFTGKFRQLRSALAYPVIVGYIMDMPATSKHIDPGLALAIKAAGTRYRLAKLLGLTSTATQRWSYIPTKRIIQVEKATGVPREKLRPDLYR